MTKKRIVTLDIIKFICSILIVFHHFQQITGAVFESINFKGGKFSFAYVVELFFMISGFFCAYTYKDEESFTSYFLRKIKRYYPMAILSIIVIVFIEGINYLLFGTPIKTDGLGIWTIFSSLTLIFPQGITVLEGLGINNPLWYLGVLNLCYILFYFLNKKINEDKILKYILVVFLMLGFRTHEINIPFFTPMTIRGYIPFFIGIVLCYAYTNNEKIVSSNKTLIAMIVFLLLILFLFKFNYYVFCDNMYGILCFIIYPILLLIMLSLDRHIKFNKLFDILGKMSFEVYIWHFPIINILITLQRLSLVEYKYSYVYMFLFSFFVIVVAFFNVLFVEKRINRLFRIDRNLN